ncbi:MAG: hypothetical protein ACRDSP_26635 [Pseudonocardiaceae bacterium]
MIVRSLVTASSKAADLLLGIDDTDNLHSRGTGQLCQQLLAHLHTGGFGIPLGATRHELFADPGIRYTSHNSSACIAWRTAPGTSATDITAAAGTFLARHSAPGSDPGLAVVRPAALPAAATAALVDFGQRAKVAVIPRDRAPRLAQRWGLHLSAHGGTGDGVLGALAAACLRLSGNDGMFLWMPGIRELGGRCSYAELRARVPVDDARDDDGHRPAPHDVIELGDWVRPVLEGGRAVLLLQPATITHGEATRWIPQPRTEATPR